MYCCKVRREKVLLYGRVRESNVVRLGGRRYCCKVRREKVLM